MGKPRTVEFADVPSARLVGSLPYLSPTRANPAVGNDREAIERLLWLWTAGEAFVLLVLQLLIPAWVIVDLHRHADVPSHRWVHVAAMPVLNLFGLFAYLEERGRRE